MYRTNSGFSVRRELEHFDWEHAQWTEEKLIAKSPFRSGDSNPSFYVWLTDSQPFQARAGDWGDSGAVDEEWRRGGFVKLLASMRRETEEETYEYLQAIYGLHSSTKEVLTLYPVKLSIDKNRKPLDIRLLKHYMFHHPYLTGRGVSEEIQRAMRVGYDRNRQAVTLPWFTPNGQLANILYRSVRSKVFWYEKGGWPIGGLLYGMDVMYRRKVKRAAIVEAPIDALYLMTCGVPAVAVGGSAFTGKKRDLLIRSPIEELVLFTDNDEAGEKMKREVKRMLADYVKLHDVRYPDGCKDPCDVGDKEMITNIYEVAYRGQR